MDDPLPGSPRMDGYWMPGEFEPHTATWMLWPDRPDNWRLLARPAQQAFAEVACAIARFEPVYVGVNPAQYLSARKMLPRHIQVVELPSNDAWMRDCGPTFIVNHSKQVRGIDWIFNAWGGFDGGLYSPWNLDDQVACRVLELADVERYHAPLVLEGGSIHVDGKGTLITTEQCLLNPNRNPHLSRPEIETLLQSYLNVEKIIWLGQGVYNDETSGHVDNLCTFVRPGVVVITWTDDKTDPQYEISSDAYDRLSNTRDARGRYLDVHKLHQPDPIYISEEESLGILPNEGTLARKPGDRLAGSYANFYICNGAVIMPQFNDAHDKPALSLLRTLFPDREVIGIYAREILLGGGNIHCITQQQPGV